MRFILAVIVAGLLSWVSGYFTEIWWLFAIPLFVQGVFFRFRSGKAFFSGFVGVLLCWGIYALIINLNNDGILSNRMWQLFTQSPEASEMGYLLILVSALIGALVGGFAILAGNYFRQLFVDDQPRGSRGSRGSKRRFY